MRNFMDEDFLLSTETAKRLYKSYAESAPILDYHCHINPQEIYENKQFRNITEAWLSGDHYKWRLMRANGVEEKYITGDGSDREKFQKWAETLELAIGNPLYHWSHLELKRYFGYNGPLNSETAEEVWQLTKEKLSSMTVRSIIKSSNVKLICTTDDPADSLQWHQKIAADSSFSAKVLPAWRPDRAMNLEKADYLDYINSLSIVSGTEIHDFQSLVCALEKRMYYFSENGCSVSDHGLEYIMYAPCTAKEADSILCKRLSGEPISQLEEKKFKTAFMLSMGRLNNKFGWVMQLHYGCRRNNNTAAFNLLGPDTGYDCISTYTPSEQLIEFLNNLEMTDELPKTILYSLNPNDNSSIVSIIGCFQKSGVACKIQQGSAWWFNDHKDGMADQIKTLASGGLLAGFNGMLTDSRSFLSYTRHEYFRRILCELIGTWVEKGEYPNDEKALKKIIKGICFNNAVNYFGFDLETI